MGKEIRRDPFSLSRQLLDETLGARLPVIAARTVASFVLLLYYLRMRPATPVDVIELILGICMVAVVMPGTNQIGRLIGALAQLKSKKALYVPVVVASELIFLWLLLKRYIPIPPAIWIPWVAVSMSFTITRAIHNRRRPNVAPTA